MDQKQIKQVQIYPKDFSDRKYFPGTPENPFHTIDTVQGMLAKIPSLIFAILFAGMTYLVFKDVAKSLLISGFFLLDWLLLRLLPIFQISYGPPTLTSLTLGILRLPFLLFNFPIALGFQVFGTLLMLYGFYIEPQFPKLTHYNVRISKPIKNNELRIVHLSDLHMEFFTSRETRAVETINALSPDIILFTGDFFNLSFQDNQESHTDIIKFFNYLNSKYGTYAVTGSPSVDLEKNMAKILPDLKLNLIRDQIVDLKVKGVPIQLIGLECTHQPNNDIHRLRRILKETHDSNLIIRILLYHSPDIAPHLQSLPIDLQLSGHTHGGQVQIPFFGPPYTGSLYGHFFSSGQYFVNNSLNLIISRGLGLEGEAAPRVRFYSPPEIGSISLEITNHHVK